MKDTISQRLKQFGMTQECLHKVAENIECLEACQTALEKSAFDSINYSDKVIYQISKGMNVLKELESCHQKHFGSMDPFAQRELKDMTENLRDLMDSIASIWMSSSEVTHYIEQEVACQHKTVTNIKDYVSLIREHLNQISACAEMLLAIGMEEL
ncbi:MAG TPA: hypothetical protein GXZ28_00430 [Clostridiales bacterium]|mgnify:CR=1 FL=1|jgi:hypothetical protein|nr:hypothetical protein [Clostridiales bacterium]